MDDADREGCVARVDVCDVSRIGLVYFVHDQTEGFAEVGVVGFGTGSVVCCTGLIGIRVGARDGEEQGVGCRTGLEEGHFLQPVEGEEMLVPVRKQDLAFEGFEVAGAEAAGDAGFEAEEAENGSERDGAGDELFDGGVLVGGVGAGGDVLLDFEDTAEGFGAGLFHDLFGEVGVDAEGLVFLLVGRELFDEVA